MFVIPVTCPRFGSPTAFIRWLYVFTDRFSSLLSTYYEFSCASPAYLVGFPRRRPRGRHACSDRLSFLWPFFGLSSVARQLLFLVACLSSCRARFSVRALVASHPPFCLGGSFRGVVFRRNHVSRASGHHSPSPEPDVMVSLLGPALAQALMRLLPQSHGTEKDANNQPLVTS